MCFSADASFGVAAALLPVGAYCLEAAWRKDRRYLPLAAVPLLFGLQQLCEGMVWVALGRGDPEAPRVPSLSFLFFALAVWPVWVPLAVAAVEPPGRRQVFLALAAAGLLFGLAYYGPVAAGGRGLGPTVIGHAIRYDFPAAVPVARSPFWAVWPAVYLAAVCLPLLASQDRTLRPLGVAVATLALVSYALFGQAFASVWCFAAATASAYLAYALHRVPPRTPEPVGSGPGFA